MSSILDQVTMASANFGNGMVYRDILDDWFRFVGGKPAEVLVVDGGSDPATQDVYWQLFKEGKIDKLQLIQKSHPENHKDKCVYQEHAAGMLANKPYILWFKIDTLPYREGHEKWLEEAIGYLDRPDTFAVGGSFNKDVRHHDAWPGWYFTHACSLNFSIMKRQSFISALEEMAGEYISSGFQGFNPAEIPYGQGRFVMEVAFLRYMARHNQYTLSKIEDPTWTVFHTNLQGEKLIQARKDFLARKDIGKYMNAGNFRYKDHHYTYYGQKQYSWTERMKMAFGESAMGPAWRGAKQAFKGAGKK